MPLRIDLHLHTHLSACSTFEVEDLIALIKKQGLPFVTVTDHGTCGACGILKEALPEVQVINGLEVTTQEGDFLIYSLDEDYIHSLGTYADTVTDLRRDDQTALIWAHPRVPQVHGWTSPSPTDPEIEKILRHVDGLEIFNGMMLSLATEGVVRMPYFNNLNYLADLFNVAITGGSDSHEAGTFFSAWTEFERDIKTPADCIAALKAGEVRPCYNRGFYDIEVDLQPIWLDEED